MDTMKKRIGIAAALAAGMLVCSIAGATTVTMGFDELQTVGNGGQYIADYYNGGCGASFNGGPATCGGPDYGVVWTGASIAEGGLYGLNAPTTPNILVRAAPNNTQGPPIVMNVANGFTSGFSFYYSSRVAANSPTAANVTLYSGLDGTGDILYTTGGLASTPTACLPHSGLFACWNFIDDLSFTGVVHSVLFGGPSNSVAWDGVSFDLAPPVTSVPEPAALGMFGLGALLIGLFAGLRRRVRQS